MKTIFNILFLISALAIVSSCEKDEGKKPNISFKTGGVYVSADVALAHTSVLVVGIDLLSLGDGAFGLSKVLTRDGVTGLSDELCNLLVLGFG